MTDDDQDQRDGVEYERDQTRQEPHRNSSDVRSTDSGQQSSERATEADEQPSSHPTQESPSAHETKPDSIASGKQSTEEVSKAKISTSLFSVERPPQIRPVELNESVDPTPIDIEIYDSEGVMQYPADGGSLPDHLLALGEIDLFVDPDESLIFAKLVERERSDRYFVKYERSRAEGISEGDFEVLASRLNRICHDQFSWRFDDDVGPNKLFGVSDMSARVSGLSIEQEWTMRSILERRPVNLLFGMQSYEAAWKAVLTLCNCGVRVVVNSNEIPACDDAEISLIVDEQYDNFEPLNERADKITQLSPYAVLENSITHYQSSEKISGSIVDLLQESTADEQESEQTADDKGGFLS